MWGKLFKDNHQLRDHTYCDSSDLNRTRKVFAGLDEICRSFDLPVPIWLDSNISEFKKVSRARFRSDSFIEEITFDYLEIQVIEEDY